MEIDDSLVNQNYIYNGVRPKMNYFVNFTFINTHLIEFVYYTVTNDC